MPIGFVLWFELVKTALFGLVEGITEWLPISSTGHMLLLQDVLPLRVSADFWDMFLVVIQLGAILAVCVLFFGKLNPFSPSKTSHEKKSTWVLWAKIVVACIPAAVIGIPLDDWMEKHLGSPYVIAAALIVYGFIFIVIEKRRKMRAIRIKEQFGFQKTAPQPLIALGASSYDASPVPSLQSQQLEQAQGSRGAGTQELGYQPQHFARPQDPLAPQKIASFQALESSQEAEPSQATALSEAVGSSQAAKTSESLAEFADHEAKIQNIEDVSWPVAIGIGIFQVLSIIPGTSRSGSTIIGGLLLGCSRAIAAEFTFFLAIPVMFGASALRLVKFFLKGNRFSSPELTILLLGCAVAFATSIVAIRFLMSFVKKHDFTPFGIYRIALGIVVIAYAFMVHLH